jgi:hypothetical protein
VLMTSSKRFAAVPCVLLIAFVSTLGSERLATADRLGWNPAAAARYLDARAEWWTTWSNAARDSGTFCMSCHTTLPYALARPALRRPLGESAPSPAEEKILGNLLRRARSWREQPIWARTHGRMALRATRDRTAMRLRWPCSPCRQPGCRQRIHRSPRASPGCGAIRIERLDAGWRCRLTSNGILRQTPASS